ncbi:MAG: hypothetical protein II990_02925 [Muribaculaceae bacterium]|nr:hypothetical protein [Muribaculaceae bacterium]
MNLSLYSFGCFSDGYTQFPGDEYIAAIIKHIVANSSSVSRLGTYRKRNLMYYVYIRHLDNDNHYIGFCVQLNSTAISNVKSLFPLFEGIVEQMVESGKIIMFDERGDIVSNTTQLYEWTDYIESVFDKIRQSLQSQHTLPLPTEDYAANDNQITRLSSNESKQNITQATTNSGYVIIEKYEQYNTPKMSTYKETLRRLHDDNKKLKEENAQILRKKKQYSFVITLCIVILICVVGMLFLDDQLSENKNELKITQQDLKEKTKELADTVSRLRDEIDTNSQLSSELSELRNKYYNLNNDYSNLKNDLMIKNDSIAELRKELEFFYPSLYEE